MLLGRDRERHELDRLLDGARSSRSGILVLAGEVGIGKTSLLDHADDQARGAGLPTLRLGGLDRASAAALVGDTVADRLYGATGGNPLALLELAPEASRLAEIPLDAPAPVVSSVARGFVSRAASLPERTRRALVLAAA